MKKKIKFSNPETIKLKNLHASLKKDMIQAVFIASSEKYLRACDEGK
jgi:hypothetical protein